VGGDPGRCLVVGRVLAGHGRCQGAPRFWSVAHGFLWGSRIGAKNICVLGNIKFRHLYLYRYLNKATFPCQFNVSHIGFVPCRRAGKPRRAGISPTPTKKKLHLHWCAYTLKPSPIRDKCVQPINYSVIARSFNDVAIYRTYLCFVPPIR
jgi:hypothetical protein